VKSAKGQLRPPVYRSLSFVLTAGAAVLNVPFVSFSFRGSEAVQIAALCSHLSDRRSSAFIGGSVVSVSSVISVVDDQLAVRSSPWEICANRRNLRMKAGVSVGQAPPYILRPAAYRLRSVAVFCPPSSPPCPLRLRGETSIVRSDLRYRDGRKMFRPYRLLSSALRPPPGGLFPLDGAGGLPETLRAMRLTPGSRPGIMRRLGRALDAIVPAAHRTSVVVVCERRGRSYGIPIQAWAAKSPCGLGV
jgi:hypothetical protein